MITDLIRPHLLGFDTIIKDAVMIGGNFVSWYGGFDSYIVAKEMNIPIYAPSMGRKQEQETGISDINYLPYVQWIDWMKELRTMRYGVHLMRTYAAGTFALNCAYWGIPCIGYRNIDTQRKLHYLTTVEEGDILIARQVALRLTSDKEYYNRCSQYAKVQYEEEYSEKVFLEKFNNILEEEKI
jgi:hypothetical protein